MSYHVVNVAEHYSIPGLVRHEQPRKHAGSFDLECKTLVGHRPIHLIPRKPVSYENAANTSKSVDLSIRSGGTAATRQNSQAWWNLEVCSIRWLEIRCCLLFIGAFFAIIATIWIYEGRPLPEWPYHLIVNTLISIYVVILKGALLVTAQGIGQLKWPWLKREHPLNHFSKFDDASRGAWGSLTLLWMLKGRHIIASCGAFITVAALLS
jgi:hypothetical protein